MVERNRIMKKKTLWVVVAVVVFVALSSSGWVYNLVKANQDAKGRELATLQTTFVQQYGGQAVIKQMVSPDRVYAAIWVSEDGVTHVSWNIGGLWVTVWSSLSATPTP